MTYPIWSAIAETPWWMFLMATSLIYIAYFSTKPRSFAFRPFIINQCLYIAFLTITLFFVSQINTSNLLLFGSFLSIGTMLGWMHYRFNGIHVNKATLQINMPGSWILFLLILSAIPAKYYFLGSSNIDLLDLYKQEKFILYTSCLTCLIMGLTAGRTYYLLSAIK